MLRFPPGLYSDVRIEEVWSTTAGLVLGRLEQFVSRHYRAAFIRVWDGVRWYYASTSTVDSIQSELDSLASMASGRDGIADDPVVRRFRRNTGKTLLFESNHVADVPSRDKLDRLRASDEPMERRSGLTDRRCYYLDNHKRKTFLSSLGADLEFDRQTLLLAAAFETSHGSSRLQESCHVGARTFGDLPDLGPALEERLDEASGFVRGSKPVDGGRMPVILSPMAAGIFAHESFGHKSEADFMLGDEAALAEWAVGRPVGSGDLNIVDDGTVPGPGYNAYDDEGTASGRTWLIRDGRLAGRLHSASTAAALGEEPTGNARSISFEYEPIPRMTTTFILPGRETFDGLVSGIDDGLFVKTVKHGSGLSTFTLAPSMSWRIRGGRLAEPVGVSVITGNVMETLGLIDGLSDTLDLEGAGGGGCGKMEQYPLPVGFGGPFVRVGAMEVR